LRRKPTEAEVAQYLNRLASIEKRVGLPGKIALIGSCALFLWPVIGAKAGVKELTILNWAIVIYAMITPLYALYVIRLARAVRNLAATKAVVFAAAMADNAFLGILLYGVMMEPLEQPWLGGAPGASLFWVYCALIARNTFLFPGTALQTIVNLLYALGYVSAMIFKAGGPGASELTEPALRELLFRTIILFLVSVCSSALYALRERRLRELDEAQEKTVRALRLDIAGMLAAQVAHELKNPLSIMTNAAFLLRRRKAAMAPEVTEQIDIIESEITRADQIITELLDYARLAEGRIEALAVNESLEESLAALKHEIESRGIRVETQYSLDLPLLFIDRGQLRQVFTNILLNACEAIQNGGRIAISTSYSRDGYIEVSISDTGQGMAPDVLSRIFKPFFTTKEKGTGMGLSIAQNVVHAYRGDINAQSRENSGTTFHLRFPTRMASRSAEEQSLSPEKAKERKGQERKPQT
jgi:signal transduction histidine kinase